MNAICGGGVLAWHLAISGCPFAGQLTKTPTLICTFKLTRKRQPLTRIHATYISSSTCAKPKRFHRILPSALSSAHHQGARQEPLRPIRRGRPSALSRQTPLAMISRKKNSGAHLPETSEFRGEPANPASPYRAGGGRANLRELFKHAVIRTGNTQHQIQSRIHNEPPLPGRDIDDSVGGCDHIRLWFHVMF